MRFACHPTILRASRGRLWGRRQRTTPTLATQLDRRTRRVLTSSSTISCSIHGAPPLLKPSRRRGGRRSSTRAAQTKKIAPSPSGPTGPPVTGGGGRAYEPRTRENFIWLVTPACREKACVDPDDLIVPRRPVARRRGEMKTMWNMARSIRRRCDGRPYFYWS